MTEYIVIEGNIISGVQLIGVFDDGNDAVEWANMFCLSSEYTVAPVLSPAKYRTKELAFLDPSNGA